MPYALTRATPGGEMTSEIRCVRPQRSQLVHPSYAVAATATKMAIFRTIESVGSCHRSTKILFL